MVFVRLVAANLQYIGLLASKTGDKGLPAYAIVSSRFQEVLDG